MKIHYMTFDLDLGIKVTQNVAQYSLHHVTYAATKFEVARFRRRCIYYKIHYILTDFNYATLTSPYIFQNSVECKLPLLR